MQINYKGKQIQRDEHGNVAKTHSAYAMISYRDSEAETLERVLIATGYPYEVSRKTSEISTAQIPVESVEGYDKFVQHFHRCRKQDSVHPGDLVYIIIYSANWKPVIETAEVRKVTYTHVYLSEPKRYRGVAHTTWDFPVDAVGKEVFISRQDAHRRLKRIKVNRV